MPLAPWRPFRSVHHSSPAPARKHSTAAIAQRSIRISRPRPRTVAVSLAIRCSVCSASSKLAHHRGRRERDVVCPARDSEPIRNGPLPATVDAPGLDVRPVVRLRSERGAGESRRRITPGAAMRRFSWNLPVWNHPSHDQEQSHPVAPWAAATSHRRPEPFFCRERMLSTGVELPSSRLGAPQ